MAANSHELSSLSDTTAMLLRPPILRPSHILDKSRLTRTVKIAAAAVKDNRKIFQYRTNLSKSHDLLVLDRISTVVPHPNGSLAGQGVKCLLLKPEVSCSDPHSWSDIIRDGVKREELSVVPYNLRLDYDYWSSHDVLSSILPEDLQDDIPSGFNTAGHVAHLNLRDQHLPYKAIIGQVILDKNSNIKTVINKVDTVGTESEFRTFAYEVLAGPDDLNVEIKESDCVFKFDYSKVYWNSKLEPEHTRLVKQFKPGEVVCDVMAGIGPFAVPAGKQGVFVWANDYNPESHRYLVDAIKRNKVASYVRPFNEDGRTFIRRAADDVLAASQRGDFATMLPRKAASRRKADETKATQKPIKIPVPATISHFVMNLPASAITFLPYFKGLYAGHEALFPPETEVELPLIHVHCFALKSDDDVPREDIRRRVSEQLGFPMTLGDAQKAGQMVIHDVRDVAPAKSMYCATFRLPPQVAFATRS